MTWILGGLALFFAFALGAVAVRLIEDWSTWRRIGELEDYLEDRG
nr:hypothetical protein 18 [bacterium]